MDIRHPRQKQRDRREDLHRQENAKVPRASGVSRCVDDEPNSCQGGCEGAEGASHFELVGQPAEGDDREEAEDVGRGGEALGLDAGEGAHLGDDGGDEEGERGEGDVAGESGVSEVQS